MSTFDAILGVLGGVIDRVITDPQQRAKAKLDLLALEGTQEAARAERQIERIVADRLAANRPSAIVAMTLGALSGAFVGAVAALGGVWVLMVTPW